MKPFSEKKLESSASSTYDSCIATSQSRMQDINNTLCEFLTKVMGIKSQYERNEFQLDGQLKRKEMRQQSLKLNVLKNQHWYFIKFITFCKADKGPPPFEHFEPYYVLGEVALVEYSLKEGIVAEYHTFIQPNQIPLGKSFKAFKNRDI